MNGISGEIQPFIGGIENTPHASEFSNRKQSEALNVQNKSGIIGELTEEEKQEVAQLKKIDAKIRAHEMAHLAASAGISVLGARFDYKTGPDGQIYALGGDVSIDTSKAPDDPEATMRKAQRVRSAALASADPSTQDRGVAAMASQMEMEARMGTCQKKE